MRYRNVKTGMTVITTGAVTGENWAPDDPEVHEYEGEDGREHEEVPKPQKGKGRGKKAAEG